MRTRGLLIVLSACVAACDSTITGMDRVDPGMLAHVARMSEGELTPAETVLVDLLRRSDNGEATDVHVPQLDSLFTLVLAERSADFGSRAAEATRRHESMVREAWQAIDDGDATTGEGRLVEARRFQSELVGERLGTIGALGYLALIDHSLDRSGERPAARTPGRYRSMLDSARDLADDARTAIREDRLADAFDIAGHAAGLANSLASGSIRD